MDFPPAIYDHPFAGRAEIVQVAADDIYQKCQPYIAVACAKIGGERGICRIYVIRGQLTFDLLRHETGHCNGWPADHPGAIYK